MYAIYRVYNIEGAGVLWLVLWTSGDNMGIASCAFMCPSFVFGPRSFPGMAV